MASYFFRHSPLVQNKGRIRRKTKQKSCIFMGFFIEKQSGWLISIFFTAILSGLAPKIRGMKSKIPFIFEKLDSTRQSKPEMPNGF